MKPARYPVPAQWHRTTTEAKRSRFITTIIRSDNKTDSRHFIEQIKGEFSDANHNCWACVIGAPGCTMQAGMSDDGEPHGAAGKPMLTTLLHSNIGDITVVVSRYFGGIRLGKGGMVRAYTAAVLHALESLPTVEKIDYTSLHVALDYPLLDQVQQLLDEYEARIQQCDYTSQVVLQIMVPAEYCARFCTHLKQLSAGTIAIVSSDN